MARYSYRCTRTACRQRKSLPHELEWYIHPPKCPACKQDSLKHDPWVRIQTIQRTCKCGYVGFPHRRGTMSRKWGICEHVDYETANDFMEDQ